MKRKSKLRITGVDRALMMLCKDLRRRCFQYRPEVAAIRKAGKCTRCPDKQYSAKQIEADHIEPVGSRPHDIKDFPNYWNRMMFLPMQGLCSQHHKEKTAKGREDKKKLKVTEKDLDAFADKFVKED